MTAQERELRNLYLRCFPEDGEAFADWFFRNRSAPERVETVCADGRVVSALHLVPKRLLLAGAVRECPFLVAVGTLPEYRRRGYFDRLMRQTLGRLYQEGVTCAALYPVNRNYYRKYGFEDAGSCRRTVLAAGTAGEELSAGEIRPEDAADCLRLYREFLSGADGWPVRTEGEFLLRVEEVIAGGGRTFCFRKSGRAVGYALAEEDVVPELIFSDPAVLSAPVLDGASAELPEWMGPGETAPANQLRIVCARAFLAGIRGLRPGSAVCFSLTDSVLPGNAGTYEMAVQADGRAQVRFAPEASGAPEISENQLASLAAGCATRDVPGALAEFFPARRVFCPEKY